MERLPDHPCLAGMHQNVLPGGVFGYREDQRAAPNGIPAHPGRIRVMKVNKALEELIQKYLSAKNDREKKSLLAIIKRKFPDAKVPK